MRVEKIVYGVEWKKSHVKSDIPFFELGVFLEDSIKLGVLLEDTTKTINFLQDSGLISNESKLYVEWKSLLYNVKLLVLCTNKALKAINKVSYGFDRF